MEKKLLLVEYIVIIFKINLTWLYYHEISREPIRMLHGDNTGTDSAIGNLFVIVFEIIFKKIAQVGNTFVQV